VIVRRTLILTICLLLSCFSLSCAGSAGNSGGNGGSGSGSGSSSGSDFGLSTEPRIELDINGQAYSEGDLLPTIYFSKGQIDVGSTIQETIVIKNTAIQGSDNLTVSVVQLNYTPPPGAADTGDAIRLVSIKKGGEAWHSWLIKAAPHLESLMVPRTTISRSASNEQWAAILKALPKTAGATMAASGGPKVSNG